MKRRDFNAALALGLGLPQVSFAQGRPLSIIVPVSSSTTSDIVARLIQPHLVTLLQRPVVVENRVGGSGIIGMQLVARSDPDGSTAMVAPNTLLLISGLHKSLPFDVKTDFVPVTPLVGSTIAAIASEQSGLRTLPDVVAAARKNPGKLNYGSPGVGTPQHLFMEAFKERYGLDIAHIPYKGSAPIIVDLGGGRIDLAFLPPHAGVDLAKRGLIRMIAVNTDSRSPLFPDVPTAKEQGFVMERLDWGCGLFLPAGVAPSLVERLRGAVSQIMKMPETKASLASSGLLPFWYEGAEFSTEVPRDVDRWKRFIERTGMRPESR